MAIRVYSPTAFLAMLMTLSFYLKAVLERMKLTRATRSGIKIMAAVKLKFYAKRENRNIPFVEVVVN
jgi:hypothetical protein